MEWHPTLHSLKVIRLTRRSRVNGDKPCFGELDFPDGRGAVGEHGVEDKRLIGRAKFAVIPNDASAKEILNLLELNW